MNTIERNFGADIHALNSIVGLIDDIIDDWSRSLATNAVNLAKRESIKDYIHAANTIKERLAWLILQLDHEYDEYYKSLDLSGTEA